MFKKKSIFFISLITHAKNSKIKTKSISKHSLYFQN